MPKLEAMNIKAFLDSPRQHALGIHYGKHRCRCWWGDFRRRPRPNVHLLIIFNGLLPVWYVSILRQPPGMAEVRETQEQFLPQFARKPILFRSGTVEDKCRN